MIITTFLWNDMSIGPFERIIAKNTDFKPNMQTYTFVSNNLPVGFLESGIFDWGQTPFWQMILDKLFECMHSCTIWFLFFKAWMQENEMKKSPAKLYIMNFISHGHLAIHFFVFQSIRHIFVTQYLLFSSPPLTLNGNYCTMYIHG